jgi:DNA-directed RNA polymerase specialized sigma24 family protein
MQILVSTDDHTDGSAELTRQVEVVVDDALGHFRDRITRAEVHFADDNSRHKFGDDDKRCVMEVRLAGIPPIAVSHRASSLEQALDGAAATLQKTLKRTLGRKDSISKRRARARVEFTTVDPQLERDVAAQDREEFLALLRPLLGHLRDHAERELRMLESNGLLSQDQVTAAELLNEVMARAWLRFAGRPRQVSLDLWLVNLLDETLDEMIKPEQRMKKSLNQPDDVRAADVPQVDDQEWWVWLLDEDETITLGDSIASGECDSGTEKLNAEELKDRIHAVLGELPKARRQAFVYNVLESFDVFEIAMLQDRLETEVQADIEAVRNTLRERRLAGSG